MSSSSDSNKRVGSIELSIRVLGSGDRRPERSSTELRLGDLGRRALGSLAGKRGVGRNIGSRGGKVVHPDVTGPRELRSSPGSRSAIGQSRSTVTSPGAT